MNFQICGRRTDDLDPIDFKICGTIQQRVYQTEAQDMNDLKQHLIDLWAGVEHSVIDNAMTSGAGISVSACEPQDILNIHWHKIVKTFIISLNLWLNKTLLSDQC